MVLLWYCVSITTSWRKTVYKEMLRGINRLEIPKRCFKIGKSPMEITYKKYGTTMYFAGSDGIDDTKGIMTRISR